LEAEERRLAEALERSWVWWRVGLKW